MAGLFDDIVGGATAQPANMFSDIVTGTPASPTVASAAPTSNMFSDIVGAPVGPTAPVPPPVTTGDLTQGPGPSLIERGETAAANAVNGTLLGGAVNALTSAFYSGQSNPIDPNTGQPLPGPTPEQQAVQAEQAPAQAYAAEPPATGALGQAATVLGTLAGGAASPESLVAGPEGYGAVRAGEAVLPTILKSAGTQAAIQGGANAVAQGENIAAGEQTTGFSPGEVAEAAGMGAVIGAAGPVVGAAVNALRGPTEDIAHGAEGTATATTTPPAGAALAKNPFADIVNGNAPAVPPVAEAPAPGLFDDIVNGKPAEATPASTSAAEQPEVSASAPQDPQAGTPVAASPSQDPQAGEAAPVTQPQAAASTPIGQDPQATLQGATPLAPTPEQGVGSALSVPETEPVPVPEAPAASQAAVPVPDTSTGIVTTPAGRKVSVQYQVVPADTLIPGAGDLQPRDRAGRLSSDAQVNAIAANLDPARLMQAPEADRGAPIVGPDNVIESGNGRVQAIQQAAANHPAVYARYVQALQDAGHDTTGIATPVLVARRVSDLSPEDRRAFVREANQSATQRMSAPEQAKADGSALTAGMLAKYDPAQDATSAANRPFVRDWIGTLPEAERNAVVDAQGNLSAEGVRRLNGAMLARAYGDNGVLARGLESTDDATRSIAGGLADAAPAWAKLRPGIDAGHIPPEFDTSRDLVHASRDRAEQHYNPDVRPHAPTSYFQL
jgi:hypothetical protein